MESWNHTRPYCSMKEWSQVGSGIKPRAHHCAACCFRCGEDQGGTGILRGPVHTLRCKVDKREVTQSTLITLGQRDGRMLWPEIVAEVMFDRPEIDFPFKAVEGERENSALACKLIIQNAVAKAQSSKLRLLTKTAEPFKLPRRILILFAIGHWKDLNECRDMFKTALQGGACVTDVDSEGSCALHYAASNPGFNSELIPQICNRDVINLRGPDGKSPLTLACERGSAPVIVKLLQLGASRDVADQFQKTCLHFAAARGDSNINNLLPDLASRCNINHQTDKLWTALHAAAFSLSASAVQLLLSAGADATLLTDTGLSALDLARTHLASSGSQRSGTRDVFYRVIRALDEATDN